MNKELLEIKDKVLVVGGTENSLFICTAMPAEICSYSDFYNVLTQ